MKNIFNHSDSELHKTILIRKRIFFSSLLSQIFEEESKRVNIPSPFYSLKLELSDDAIKEGIQALDNYTFREIHRTSYPQVERMILQNNGTVADAQDVFQNAVIILIEKVQTGNFKLEYSIKSYLYSVAHKIWQNEYRKSKKRNKIFVKEKQLSENIDSTMKGEIIFIDTPDNFEVISEYLDALSDSCKKLIEEYYYKNQDWSTIANTLGYASAGSARNQKYKCLESLKKKLN